MVDDFTQKAMSFIEINKEKPFFCYLPFNTPHSPMQVPDPYWDRFKEKELEFRHRDEEDENLEHTRAALAMCENIDWNVGRLLDQLDRLSLSENTIVIYFCDNGPNGRRWNGGMKGRKGSTDEGGVRSPLLIRWPAKIQAGTIIKEIGGAIDLLPTLADLAEIELKTDQPVDGISLKSLLKGEPYSISDRMLFSHWNGRVSVRNQQFRLDHQGALFDMVNDGQQRQDISEKNVLEAAALKAAVAQWKNDVLKDYRKEERAFTVGHPGYPVTQLPARDAKGIGDIERSNRFPNDSYFMNWTSSEAHLTWDIEVLQPGLFDVVMYQTCSAEEHNALMELEFNGNRLRARFNETWDPTVEGHEHDSVQRQESYVKDFKPFKMGRIQLPKGKGILRLKALDIPGKKAPEFRLMELIRKDN